MSFASETSAWRGLLAELKAKDKATWEDIFEWADQLECDDPGSDLGQALIQNGLQRACEARGWYWQVAHGEHIGYMATVDIRGAEGESAAMAMLRAYLGAL